MGSQRRSVAIAALIALAGSLLSGIVSPHGAWAALPQKRTANAKTIVDLSTGELRHLYRTELRDVAFDPSQKAVGTILWKVGQNVEAFFRNIPNTASKELILSQRLKLGGQIEATVTSYYNYLLLVRPDREVARFQEDRSDSKGNPVNFQRLSEFIVTSGFAGHCFFFHPGHQDGSRFRYLGREASESHALVIAFAQKPEVGDYLAYIGAKELTPVLLQGLVWIDPDSYQILRMRTDLLEPDQKDGVARQTTEIWLGEVRFDGTPQPFWLPREVRVTIEWAWAQRIFRNVHTYTDYKLFSVSSFDKIVKP